MSFSAAARWSALRLARQRRHLYRHHSFSNQPQGQLDPTVDPFIARYLSRLHIAPRLHEGICTALASVYGKPLTVTHLKSFGDDALQHLGQSVESTLPQVGEHVRTVKIDVPHHKTHYQLEWRENMSLLELARSNPDLMGEYMEGTCGGTMSCCTCHVYLSEAMYQALEPPCVAELDMLDLAYDPKPTSRLACQVRLNHELLSLQDDDDMVVTIPADVINVWS